MPKRRAQPTQRDPKAAALRRARALHLRPEAVTDPLFDDSGFFDPRDIVQVKYEMLRRVSVDQHPVSHSAAAFGFSRPSFYQAQTAFEQNGLNGLVPKKPGPRRAHKLTAAVVNFMEQLLAEEPALGAPELAQHVHARFGLTVHPRSIERALARPKKKPR